MHHKERGAVSVEAIITLTIFIMFYMLLLSIIDIIRAQVVVQSAICETAKEISTYSYMLAKMGYFDLRQEASDSASGSSLNDVKDNFVSLTNTIGAGGSVDASELSQTIELLKGLTLKDFTGVAIDGAMEAGSNAAASLAARTLAKKYLKDAKGSLEYLEDMGIENGLEGLDFSQSHFPQSTGDTLRITVIYKIKILDYPLLEKLNLNQRVILNATTKVWGN